MRHYYLLMCLPAFGQVVTPLESETLDTYKKRVKAHWEQTTVARQETSTASAIIASQPTVTGENSAWAERANGALTDYLPLFQFAVNAIDTNSDQDRVTASFNPIRNGEHGVIQLRATASKPEVSPDLLAILPASIREQQEQAISDQLDVLSDLTFAVSYGYQRTAKNKSWQDVGRLWGRNYAIYEDLVNSLLAEVLSEETQARRNQNQQALHEAEKPLISLFGNILNKTMTEVAEMFGPTGLSFNDYLKLIDNTAQSEMVYSRELAANSLDRLPALINNQPQLNFRMSYRTRHGLSGQSGFAFGLTYEHGLHNLNRVARKHQAGKDLLSALKEVAAATHEERFTFSLTYKQLNALTVDYEYTVADTPNEHHAMLIQDPYQEWQGGLAWSRKLNWEFQVGDFKISPMFGLGMEYTSISDNPMLRDRLLGSLGLVLPLPRGVSLPLTLVYANHGRHRGTVDKDLNVHLGLNYKFSRNRQ